MSPESPVVAEPRHSRLPRVSVIVPARNEEASLGACLRSIAAQSGVEHEIIVVDDQSTDSTRRLAGSFPGVKVVSTGELPSGWSGKCNAAWAGAQIARGEWLLFTDADTVHLPGSLCRSLQEAEDERVALLSYSPEQQVRGLLQWAAMPAIFAELAATYPPRLVCDPASPIAAANGQYLLISRVAYDAVGGHQAVSASLLEDLELAKRVKAPGNRIRLRHGRGLVRTRMYRDTRSLVEGWTKNLALLFPRTARLALVRLAEFAVIVTGIAVAAGTIVEGNDCAVSVRSGLLCNREFVVAVVGFAALCWLRVLKRVRRAH
ncbi:MAG TPA: glycosyltransferase family 2 protein, partial [Terriglobales bacterium]|nr:glycosyltransferase family 2 protein [Terriglobales bacterium]